MHSTVFRSLQSHPKLSKTMTNKERQLSAYLLPLAALDRRVLYRTPSSASRPWSIKEGCEPTSAQASGSNKGFAAKSEIPLHKPQIHQLPNPSRHSITRREPQGSPRDPLHTMLPKCLQAPRDLALPFVVTTLG